MGALDYTFYDRVDNSWVSIADSYRYYEFERILANVNKWGWLLLPKKMIPMNKKLSHFLDYIKTTFKEFGSSDPIIYAGAIAFFTIFALPAILVLIIMTSGNLFGEEAITGELSAQVRSLIGPDGATAIEKIVKNASQASGGFLATIISLVTLFIAATTVFTILQTALNKIWHVKPQPKRGWLKFLKDRAISFAIVISMGFLLAVSLALDTFISAFTGFIEQNIFDSSISILWLMNFIISFALVTLVFGLIFKVLPDAKIRWRDVWIGAMITAALFVAGKFVIGAIIGNSTLTSTYGAAGSVVVILLWVYFSTIILLLGAEITQVYAREVGQHIRPANHAVRIKENEQVIDENKKD
ncbi:YihY/virulence factor BrkB family protein [Candidatus Falkowbacteria bacterium]|jgi:membrane protein|nr:YihY/virulence factor BrkB family protein [Candidatus Falkowbacteria bacterium]